MGVMKKRGWEKETGNDWESTSPGKAIGREVGGVGESGWKSFQRGEVYIIWLGNNSIWLIIGICKARAKGDERNDRGGTIWWWSDCSATANAEMGTRQQKRKGSAQDAVRTQTAGVFFLLQSNLVFLFPFHHLYTSAPHCKKNLCSQAQVCLA